MIVIVLLGTAILQYLEKKQLWRNKVLIEQASAIGRINHPSPQVAVEAAKSDDHDASAVRSPTESADPRSLLELDRLWAANRQQIETYHKIVLGYASSSRIYTLTALSVGFVFIAIIGYVAVHASGTATAVSASIVTAVSATLTGFVARATLRNSESSSQELRAFFEHPLDLERALAAERLADGMNTEEEKAEARLIVINYLTQDRTQAAKPKTPAKPKTKLRKTRPSESTSSDEVDAKQPADET